MLIGQYSIHVYVTYPFHELLILFLLMLVDIFKVWFLTTSKKHSRYLHTTSDQIKIQ